MTGTPPSADASGDWRKSNAYTAALRSMRGMNRDSLLAMLGGLSMHPANAPHLLRLEGLAHVAATLPGGSDRRHPSWSDARRIASRAGSGLLAATPDPNEQPFAIPLVFRNTLVVAPLGLILGADYDARRMFEVLSALAHDVPPTRPPGRHHRGCPQAARDGCGARRAARGG